MMAAVMSWGSSRAEYGFNTATVHPARDTMPHTAPTSFGAISVKFTKEEKCQHKKNTKAVIQTKNANYKSGYKHGMKKHNYKYKNKINKNSETKKEQFSAIWERKYAAIPPGFSTN